MLKVKLNKKAFSLMEVVFYMVLVGILIAIAVPNLGKLKEKAELTVIKADTGSIRNMALLEGIDSDLPIKKNSLKQTGNIYLNGELVDNLDANDFYEIKDSIYSDSGTKLDGGFYINDSYDVVYVDDSTTRTQSLEDLSEKEFELNYSIIYLQKEEKIYRFTFKEYEDSILKTTQEGNIVEGPLYKLFETGSSGGVKPYAYGLSINNKIDDDKVILYKDYLRAMVKEKSHKAVLMSDKTKSLNEMGISFKNNLYTMSYSTNKGDVDILESKVY